MASSSSSLTAKPCACAYIAFITFLAGIFSWYADCTCSSRLLTVSCNFVTTRTRLSPSWVPYVRVVRAVRGPASYARIRDIKQFITKICPPPCITDRLEKLTVVQRVKGIPKFHRTRSSPYSHQPVAMFSQMNPLHTTQNYFLKIDFNIILPC
jgi:hypothetical protein